MSYLKNKLSFSLLRNVVIVLSIVHSSYYLLFVEKMDIKSFIILSIVIWSVVTLLYFIFRNASEGVQYAVKFGIALFFGLGALLTPSFTGTEANKYTRSVENFEQVTVSGINTLKEDHDMWLYIGRETCPYCYEFAPKLADAIENSNTRVYYLDTESEDEQLQEFADNYEINSVPTFVYLKDGSITARMEIAKETTSKDIKTFIDSKSGDSSQVSKETDSSNIAAWN